METEEPAATPLPPEPASAAEVENAEAESLSARVARELGETELAPRAQIERLVEHLGAPFVEDILAQTWRTEAQGGLMVLDGSRRRTPGGVFFHLARQRLIDEQRFDDLNVVFPVSPRKSEMAPARIAPPTKSPPLLPSRTRPRRKSVTPDQERDKERSTTLPPPRLSLHDLPRLWMAVADGGEEQININTLTLAWYGPDASDADEASVAEVLAQPQPYFILQGDTGMVRVRPLEALTDEGINVLHAVRALQPGALLLLSAGSDKLRVARCAAVSGERVDVHLPADAGTRTRYQRPDVREVLGAWPAAAAADDVESVRQLLAQMLDAAKRWQWQHQVQEVAGHMQPEKCYRFDELAAHMALAPDDLAGRLGLALSLNENPKIFGRQEIASRLHQESCYTLQPGWQKALAKSAVQARPDQARILSVIERHVGTPPELYRRSVNPDTGAVVLSFHFPEPAQEQYGAAIQAAAAEAQVPITINPRPHQGALIAAAQALVPDTLTVLKTSVYQELRVVRLRCQGKASAEALEQACTQFHTQTGWALEVALEDERGEGCLQG
jgi:hypothetical protein